MTIKETTATVYVTEDGTHHTSLEDAREHEFRAAVDKWAMANCWTGMSPPDVADAIVGDRVRLATIMRDGLAPKIIVNSDK